MASSNGTPITDLASCSGVPGVGLRARSVAWVTASMLMMSLPFERIVIVAPESKLR